MNHKNWKLYLWLFRVNLLISAFTFGGGYVVVPMIRKYFVEQKKLFGEEELIDMAAVAQSSPGAIAINLAAMAGYRTAKMPGVFVSCISAVLPAFVILAAVSFWYFAFISNIAIAAALRGMQAAAAALIVDVAACMWSAVTKMGSPLLILMAPAVFCASFFFHIQVAVILAACAGICVIKVWRDGR